MTKNGHKTSGKKAGAPIGNNNGLRHGRHSRRVIPMGTLSTRYAHVTRVCNFIRRQLESAVIEQHGEISLVAAATINTAVRHERHAQLAQKWLRDNPKLPVETRLAISRDIAKASTERDRAIRLLLPINGNPDAWSFPALPEPAGTMVTDDSGSDSSDKSDRSERSDGSTHCPSAAATTAAARQDAPQDIQMVPGPSESTSQRQETHHG
jgi:hypothetical protein